MNEPQAALVSCRFIRSRFAGSPAPSLLWHYSALHVCRPGKEGCLTKWSPTQPPFTCIGASEQPLRGPSRALVTGLLLRASTAGRPGG